MAEVTSVRFGFNNWFKTASRKMTDDNMLEKGEATIVTLEEHNGDVDVTVVRAGQKDRMYMINTADDFMQVGYESGSSNKVEDEVGLINTAEKEALFWAGEMRRMIYVQLGKAERTLQLTSDGPKMLVWSGGTKGDAEAGQLAEVAEAKASKPELEAKVRDLQAKALIAERLVAKLVTISNL